MKRLMRQYWQMLFVGALCALIFVIPPTPVKAAVVKGTNCGFVAVSPTDDPAATATVDIAMARAVKDVAPEGATAIIEVGVWEDSAQATSNFEVGLYNHNSTDNKPLNRLNVDNTNAKGTDAGWQKVTGLNWPVTEGTTYWIAYQIDGTLTINNSTGSGTNSHKYLSATTLTDPFSASSTSTTALIAIYAVYETADGGTHTGYYRRRM